LRPHVAEAAGLTGPHSRGAEARLAANDPAPDPRFARLAAAAEAGERRTLAAVARLGEEMTRLGRALDSRISQAEGRTAGELAAVRRELQGLQRSVAQRLGALEAGEAEALRSLREDMARGIAELTARLEGSERVTATALDGLGRRLEAFGAEARAGEARIAQAVDARLEAGRARTEHIVGEIRADISRHEASLCALTHAASRRDRLASAVVAALLVMAGLAAAVSLTAVGVQLLAVRSAAPPSAAIRLSLPLRPTLPAELPPPVAAPAPQEIPGAPPSTPAPPVAKAEDYTALAQAITRGDKAALAHAQALAAAGAPVAEMLVAKLYETGAAGLPRDMALARQWTERAAQGGERAAMHNLAVFMSNGEGGPADVPGAARWFARAAAAGVVDAQYNLGLLYENGRGVPKNLAEAYRWYSIAANAGDGLARGKAVELEPRLTRTERSQAAQAVRAFDPTRPAQEAAAPAAPVIAPAATVAETQKMLARAGYFIGPTDGADGESYRAAVLAYLRDHPQAARPTL